MHSGRSVTIAAGWVHARKISGTRGIPIVLPSRKQHLFTVGKGGEIGFELVLAAARQPLGPKCQTRLLDNLPEHWRVIGRITLLQPVAAGEEIIDGGAGMIGIADRERMSNDAGTRRFLAIGEPALISIHAIGNSKI